MDDKKISRSINKPGKINFRIENIGLIGILILLILLFWIIYPEFISIVSIVNILLSVSLIGIIAVPWSMLCISGGLDISVGSMMGFSAMIIASFLSKGINFGLALFIGLIIAALGGLINGILITKVGINSIITTLGMLSILRGAAFVVSKGHGISGFTSEGFKFLGRGRIWILPFPVFILIFFFIIGYLVLKYTPFGRNVYATGKNENAALLSGISTNNVRIILYIVTAMSAGLAGLIAASQFQTALPGIGQRELFAVITAVVLGGVSLAGGKGKLYGVVLGLLIIGTIDYGMRIIGIFSFFIMIAEGTILLIAVALDQIKIVKAV